MGYGPRFRRRSQTRSAVSQLRAPATRQLSVLLATEGRRCSSPVYFIFFFLAEIISGRTPGSWQGAQLSCKCNCGGCGSIEEQAAGTGGPSHHSLQRSSWDSAPMAVTQGPRTPTAQAVGLSIPTRDGGLALSLEDRKAARQGKGTVGFVPSQRGRFWNACM